MFYYYSFTVLFVGIGVLNLRPTSSLQLGPFAVSVLGSRAGAGLFGGAH